MKIAIIPARGGSKRIPRKNIKLFAGLPMIAHPIQCALQSNLFDRVIVSTDDDEIAKVAQKYGAEVPFIRPPELSDDHANTASVMVHAIDWLRNSGVKIEAVCCIYATSPFVQAEDLKNGLELLKSGEWRIVFSATSFAYPIFRSFAKVESGGLKMFYPEYFDTRSQDLPEAFHDAGQFYWGQEKAWHDGSSAFELSSTIVQIPRWRVQDIDTYEDWERAEIMWGVMNGPNS